jgi:poly-gamma-glutamate synthesis protein (capsule biosynthesis protein)
MGRTSTLVSAVFGLMALALAGCTDTEPSKPSKPSKPFAQPRTGQEASPSSTTEATPMRQPLAIVVHPSRAPLDVNEDTARQIVHGTISATGLGENLRIVTAGAPAARVRNVARDVNAVAIVPASRVNPSVAAVTVDGVNPIQSPARYPLVAMGAAPPDPVTIEVVGDIMMARGVAASMGSNEFMPLRAVADELRSADLTIGNLESSLSQGGAPTQGSDSFGADPQVLTALRRAGFDILSLANNHVGDYGVHALEQTLDEFRGSGIKRVGAGSTTAAAYRPVITDVHGLRVGVIAFNSIGESPAATRADAGVAQLRMPPRTGPLNHDDLRRLVTGVERLSDRVDVVLVMPHWGEQYTSRPLPLQRRIAVRLADAGATAVLGGHPHWVQGLELHGKSLIAYSLGNFIFDMDFSEPTMQGLALQLTFWDDRLMAVTPRPLTIEPDFSARFVDNEKGQRILEGMWANSFGTLAG